MGLTSKSVKATLEKQFAGSNGDSKKQFAGSDGDIKEMISNILRLINVFNKMWHSKH